MTRGHTACHRGIDEWGLGYSPTETHASCRVLDLSYYLSHSTRTPSALCVPPWVLACKTFNVFANILRRNTLSIQIHNQLTLNNFIYMAI